MSKAESWATSRLPPTRTTNHRKAKITSARIVLDQHAHLAVVHLAELAGRDPHVEADRERVPGRWRVELVDDPRRRRGLRRWHGIPRLEVQVVEEVGAHAQLHGRVETSLRLHVHA